MGTWIASGYWPLVLLMMANSALCSNWLGQPTTEEPPRGKENTPRLIARIESPRTCGVYALSPDGKRLAYGESFSIDHKGRTALVLVDLTSGKELARRSVPNVVRTLVFSRDGNLLATGGSGDAAAIWEVTAWEPKRQLKVPAGHQAGHPLAFSPDGKQVAGAAFVFRKEKADGQFTVPKYHLATWDLSTGEARVFESDGASFQTDAYSYPARRMDFDLAEVESVTYPDNGVPLLFVQYRAFGVITAWDTGRGKALSSYRYGGTEWYLTMQGTGVCGKGDPAPGSPPDRYRFRLSPSGYLLGFPKYNRPPITIVPNDKDGTIGVYVTPNGMDYGTSISRLGAATELSRLDVFKNTVRRSCRLTADGKRLVAVGWAPKKSKDLEEAFKDPKGLICIWDLSGQHEAARKMQQQEDSAPWEALFKEFPNIEEPPGMHNHTLHAAFSVHQSGQSQAAMASLVAQPKEAVPWLRKRMGPLLDRERVPRLLKALERRDNERDVAYYALRQWGHMIRHDLQASLKDDPSSDKEERLRQILDHVKATAVSREFRELRIIDVLEHIHTTEARELLHLIADGRYGAEFAEEAKKALKRSAARQ